MAELPPTPATAAPPLRLLSIVIPARDEESTIASMVEHLHLGGAESESGR